MYCTRASSCVEKPDYLQKADVKHTAILESSDPLRTNGRHIMYLCSHSCECTILVLFYAAFSGSPHNVLHSTIKQIGQKTFQSIPFHKNQLPTCACHMSMFMYLLSGMDAKFHPTPNACLSGCSCFWTHQHSLIPRPSLSPVCDQIPEVWKGMYNFWGHIHTHLLF